MAQSLTGGVIASAGAGHRHAAGGVGAAVLGRVQLPAELTADGEGEVGLGLSRLVLRAHRDSHTYSGLIKAAHLPPRSWERLPTGLTTQWTPFLGLQAKVAAFL